MAAMHVCPIVCWLVVRSAYEAVRASLLPWQTAASAPAVIEAAHHGYVCSKGRWLHVAERTPAVASPNV